MDGNENEETMTKLNNFSKKYCREERGGGLCRYNGTKGGSGSKRVNSGGKNFGGKEEAKRRQRRVRLRTEKGRERGRG